jgi:hypothetical protein
MQQTVRLKTAAPTRAVTREPGHHFFGYYDKTPWDASGRYLLALQAPFGERPPGPDDVATLGVVDLHDGETFEPFAETRAWNWQQGCMLQWLPSAMGQLVIYNDRDGDHFVSIVRDALSGREIRRLPRPIYALSRDGAQALSLNFSRLHHQRPGYGYAGLPDRWQDVAEPEDDGIYWMDLDSGQSKLIISIAQAARLSRKPSMEGAVHRFNHLQFSPDDAQFIFLHRWRPPIRSTLGLDRRLRGGLRGLRRLVRRDEEFANASLGRRFELGLRGLRRVLVRNYGAGDPGLTRLNVARADGTEIAIVADEDVVSHFDWSDPQHILAWARHRGVDGFFLFELNGEATLVNGEAMPRDGHCSYSPDAARRWILNDTAAPDDDDCRELYVYDTRAGRRLNLGRFYSPPGLQGDFRCDLHPRWSRDGRQVCFDSAHGGSRQLYVMDLSQTLDPD